MDAARERRELRYNSRMPITLDHFTQVEMRVGRIVHAEDFPEARKPSYKLTVDFGPLGLKRSSAGLSPFYRKDELVGRLVVAVVNFPPRQVATFMSEVLVLGAMEEAGRVVLLQPDSECPLGTRIG